MNINKTNNNLRRFLAAILAVVLVFTCMPAMNVYAAGSKGKIKSVTVTNLPAKTLTLQRGKSKVLKVKVAKSGKISSAVTFKSSKPQTVSVTKKGKVTAKKKGTAKITIASKADKKKKTVITVTVGTPVTKISLNKTSVSVITGKTTSLKATVVPKKASNKKIIWSSSDKKIATVDNKGKIKGISAGTARITATAADGSGKKKTAKVIVSKPVIVPDPVVVPTPVVLKTVSVVNTVTIRVDLTGEKPLTTSNFVVRLNKSGKGTYNRVCKVDNVATTNHISYLVALNPDYAIDEQDNVQVTVTGLDSGTASMTTVYDSGVCNYTYSNTFYMTVNEKVNKTLEFKNVFGYCVSTVTGLPAGVKYKDNGKNIRFYGKLQQEGKVVSRITSMDEVGNTCTSTITWLINNEKSISAAANNSYYVLNANGTVDVDGTYVIANGGSGSYNYSLIGNTHGLQIDSKGVIRGKLMAEGTYSVTASIEDSNNAANKTTTEVLIYVCSAVSISGIIKDLSGNPIPSARILCTNKDKANKYMISEGGYSNSNGSFSVRVVPGNYDVKAYCNEGATYLYDQSFTTTRSGLDITLPMQKVVIDSDNAAVDPKGFGTWYDEDGTAYGSGNIFWMEIGNHTLMTSKETGNQRIDATVKLNVTEKGSVSATAAVTITKSQREVIKADKAIETKVTNEYTYYIFKPTVTGTYYFYSQGSTDTFGRLEDSNGECLKTDDESMGNHNFYFSYNCEKNKTYYVGIKNIWSWAGTTTLYVSAKNPKSTT